MSSQGKGDTSRRNFVKAAAAGGTAGLTVLAGCTGGSNPTEGEGTEATTVPQSELGNQLSTITVFNNPPQYDPARHDAINLMAESMRKLGLDIKVEVLEFGAIISEVLGKQDFDICSWNHSLKDEPGWRLRWMFHSDNVPADVQGNWYGYSKPRVDELIDKQAKVTGEERVSALFEIQEHLARDCPHIPALHSPDLVAYNSDQVSGWVKTLHHYNDFINQTTIEVDNPENELRGYWSETIQSLNPLGSVATAAKTIYNLNLLYDKILRLNPNNDPDPNLGVATDWSRPNSRSVEYVIREGHTWHDGEDLTAEDVAFTLRYQKEKGTAVRATQTEKIKSVERDGNTVRVNFNQVVGPVHSIFSNQFHVIPKHIWKDIDQPAKRKVREPVGSGPLKFDYWDVGTELSLVRNEDHWRPTNYARRIWRIIPESSTVWELLNQGDLNYMPKARIGKQLVDNAKKDHIGVASKPSDSTIFVGSNIRRKKLEPLAVRQAIHHSIPKTAIHEQLFYGYGKRGWNIIPGLFGKFSNPDVKRFEEGIEPGKNRLREAGFGWGDDGRLRFPASGDWDVLS